MSFLESHGSIIANSAFNHTRELRKAFVRNAKLGNILLDKFYFYTYVGEHDSRALLGYDF